MRDSYCLLPSSSDSPNANPIAGHLFYRNVTPIHESMAGDNAQVARLVMNIESPNTDYQKQTPFDFSRSVSLPKYNNYEKHRNDLFLNLQQVIGRMAKLPDDSHFHISEEARARSSSILGFINQNLTVEPPQIYSQDSEDLAMKFSFGSIVKTVIAGECGVDPMISDRESRNIEFIDIETSTGEFDPFKLRNVLT